MRVGFPVIFIRNGAEFAGIVATSSPRKDQVPIEDLNTPLTQEQRFNELRCSIAFYDLEVNGWKRADNVPYLSIDQEIPSEGDYYSEVGAPDAHERVVLREAQAKHAAQMEEGRKAFLALPPEEQARIRAANEAASEMTRDRRAPTPITGHAERQGLIQGAELAAEELRSPDPVEDDAPSVAGAGR
jgi:hypothetical protein